MPAPAKETGDTAVQDGMATRPLDPDDAELRAFVERMPAAQWKHTKVVHAVIRTDRMDPQRHVWRQAHKELLAIVYTTSKRCGLADVVRRLRPDFAKGYFAVNDVSRKHGWVGGVTTAARDPILSKYRPRRPPPVQPPPPTPLRRSLPPPPRSTYRPFANLAGMMAANEP